LVRSVTLRKLVEVTPAVPEVERFKRKAWNAPATPVKRGERELETRVSLVVGLLFSRLRVPTGK
jgi:hypothetical protein